MGIVDWSRRKFQDFVGEGSGTAGKDMEGGIRSPKPYSSYYSNGLFQGEDGSMWLYFKMPEDVKVEYLSSYQEAANNQSFLTTVFNALGNSLFNDTETTRKDARIRFHLPMIREITTEIQQYDGITQAHSDFLKRMNVQKRQVWHGYFGVELQMGSINSDVYGVSNKVRHYVDFMMGKADFEYNLYKESIQLVTSVCMDNGMTPLDFESEPADFERLTAWYGVSDDKYGMRREMTSTALMLPEHGKSIFVPGYNEISFSALRPRESRDMFVKDPYNPADVRFGKALLKPGVNSVHINIRGEIRSPRSAVNIFDDKNTRSTYKLEGADTESSSVADRKNIEEQNQHASIAVGAADAGYAFLDNVEIVVANIVDGKKSDLTASLTPYNLEAVNCTMRQHFALNSTVPAYPNPIFKVPAGNARRNPNVNNFYAGVLSLSGLFSSTKPAGKKGILLGLSDANFEFKEIFTETDAASKYKKPPLILVTGMTRSGKTVQMLMMMAQIVYMGQNAIFLNPKPQESLKSMFDLLDGITVNMSNRYMNDNPGMLDPMFFLEDREDVGKLLADMIIRAQGQNSKSNARTESIRSQEELIAEMVERAKMPANECSYDIIFGNGAAGTPRISDDETVKFIRQKMKTSSFWKASISQNPDGRSNFRSAIQSGRPFLVEWDTGITMPQTKNEDDWTQSERDAVQSVVNMFRFGTEVIGTSRKGGAIFIDEAHVLKYSEVAMSQVKTSGRVFASQDINLVLATQNLSDFLDDDEYNIRPYVRIFMIMKVPDQKKELDIFFDVTKLPRDEMHKSYITNAGIDNSDNVKNKKNIPSLYLIDTSYGPWEGGLIAGPFPSREVRAAAGKNINDIMDDGAQIEMLTYEQMMEEEGLSDDYEKSRSGEL